MVSTRTESRLKKIELLKDALNLIIGLMLLEHKQRERIHIAEYKKTVKKLKEMLEKAKTKKI